MYQSFIHISCYKTIYQLAKYINIVESNFKMFFFRNLANFRSLVSLPYTTFYCLSNIISTSYLYHKQYFTYGNVISMFFLPCFHFVIWLQLFLLLWFFGLMALFVRYLYDMQDIKKDICNEGYAC